LLTIISWRSLLKASIKSVTYCCSDSSIFLFLSNRGRADTRGIISKIAENMRNYCYILKIRIVLEHSITVCTTRGDFRFPPKTKKVPLEKGEIIKRGNQWPFQSSVFGQICAGVRKGLKGLVVERGGCGKVEGPKRVRLEGESRESEPRRRGAENERRAVELSPFHARILSSSVVPRKFPKNDRKLQRRQLPRDDQG
jgi:hypothetical protein